jgi:hypothetical protein
MRKVGSSRRATWLAPLLFAPLACGGVDEPHPTSGSTQATAPQLERPASGRPFVESVRLSPSTPLPGSTITASAETSHPEGRALRMTYVWLVNAREVERGAKPTILLPDLRKGDRIEVAVFASDGQFESDPRYASAIVANRPPVLEGIQLEVVGDPGVAATRARPGDRLIATPQGRDPDGDELDFTYTWFVNGSARGQGREFSTHGLRRGDRMYVRVVASDGEAMTPAMESSQVVLENSPPRITGLPQLELEDGALRYSFQAVDEDGDRNLRFWLERGPDGMSIDPLLGVLAWHPHEGQIGTHEVEIGVRDEHGDGSTFLFEVTVSPAEVEAEDERDTGPAAPDAS